MHAYCMHACGLQLHVAVNVLHAYCMHACGFQLHVAVNLTRCLSHTSLFMSAAAHGQTDYTLLACLFG